MKMSHDRDTKTYAEVKYSHSFLLHVCVLSAHFTWNGRTLYTFASKENAALIFSSLLETDCLVDNTQTEGRGTLRRSAIW